MILVTTAGGFIGRALVERLDAEGLPVRVFLARERRGRPIRTTAQGKVLASVDPQHPNVEQLEGSFADQELVHRAMVDVHTVYHLAGAQWWGKRSDLQRIDERSAENVIIAARAARVGRLIALSQLGATLNNFFDLMRIKGEIEKRIRDSGIAYTILRTGIIFGEDDSFVNGIAMLLHTNPAVFLQPGLGENLLHPLYVNDLIEVLFRALESIDTVDQTLDIGGVEYVSFNEMIRTVMRVTGNQRSIAGLPPWLLRALCAALMRVFPYYPMTPQWLDMVAANRTAPIGNLYNYFGVHAARFEDTLLKYMPDRHYGRELIRTLLRRA